MTWDNEYDVDSEADWIDQLRQLRPATSTLDSAEVLYQAGFAAGQHDRNLAEGSSSALPRFLTRCLPRDPKRQRVMSGFDSTTADASRAQNALPDAKTQLQGPRSRFRSLLVAVAIAATVTALVTVPLSYRLGLSIASKNTKAIVGPALDPIGLVAGDEPHVVIDEGSSDDVVIEPMRKSPSVDQVVSSEAPRDATLVTRQQTTSLEMLRNALFGSTERLPSSTTLTAFHSKSLSGNSLIQPWPNLAFHDASTRINRLDESQPESKSDGKVMLGIWNSGDTLNQLQQ
ncbi:MAG: hypothetical protein HKN47_14850 [Pirellulaceae bacterium]|nr:hypothetical protein [Pirellulaceae bacterium]